ncbi:MAG TPA: hypothetical protein PLD80_02390 [Rugosibacter sp.]|nr:hypothetical protein [Rugosibacter sp.]HQN46004.1 hypothetical protein [Rugosibacter sp.]
MFDRIKRFVRDIRVDLDFPRYERQQLEEHEQLAQKRFSTKQLDDEKTKLLNQIELQASSKFDASIHENENTKSGLEIGANNTKYLLSFFVRDYKQELDELYAEKDALFSKKDDLFQKKNEIRDTLSEAFEEKNKAHSELNYYKDQIDSWYAKSDRTPWLFGNSGKKLPKHSLFGQSFGDLDSYKYHRDAAYGDVRDAKSRISVLKQEQHELHAEIGEVEHSIGELFGRINQVKKDRSEMYDLKEAGHNRRDLQTKLDKLDYGINKLKIEVREIVESKKEYIGQEKHRYGVVQLEAKISEIEQNKRQFIESFNLEENQQDRKRLHREIWLKQRGVA